MLLYHGSQFIIEKPEFGKGKKNNDYGQGFYCTEDAGLAGEWAVDFGRDGYINCYELDCEGLEILNLRDPEYGLLEWLAVLLKHRDVAVHYPMQKAARQYILDHFSLDVSRYDLIRGYRADDSYFTFARDFLSGAISYRQLSDAMHLGDLGEQIVLKSTKAFERIRFSGSIEVSADEWYARKQLRDAAARRKYSDMDMNQYLKNGLFMNQILSEEMRRDDRRLR